MIRNKCCKRTLHYLFSKVRKMKRWDLQWEWMSEFKDGNYVNYYEVIDLIIEELKKDAPSKMKRKFVEAIDKVSTNIMNMSNDEFNSLIEKHKDGENAKILRDLGLSIKSIKDKDLVPNGTRLNSKENLL